MPGAGPGDLTPLHVLRSLDATPRGLTEQDATERLALYGPNTLPAHRTVSWPVRLVRSLRDPFTAVLLVLGLVSAAVASWGTACVILTLVAVSCALRSHGEHRAENAVRHLRELVASTATVRRRDTAEAAPRTRETPVDELVPGDVIRLGPGDLVPADVRLLRAHGLTVDQSALTGESAPVAKEATEPPGPGGGTADGAFTPPHLCFQGSSVASGSASAVVVATGAGTRFAAAHTGRGPRASTAFDRSVHGISWVLIRFMLITPPLVLMANAALRGRGLETLPFAVAVAVGLTPEMLPVIVTTCLARGAALLARTHGVIVRRLPALHDLGAVDVLCVDKTGTLTQDRPEVAGAYDAAGQDAPDVLGWAAANAWWTLQLADLPAPDALDEALLDAVDPEEAMAHDGVAALPFTPERRVSTAVVRMPGALGERTLIVKGAVESVVERCALTDAEREEVLAHAGRRAAAGLRVLAVATAERPARTGEYTPAVERGLTLRGLVAFRDALAPGADHALAGLAERGVTVKVLTGDHPATAARACRDLGLDPGDVVGADRIDALTDEALAALAATTTVFARCTPEHKARITAALRRHGHTTGFLGDGVNDLPALRAADVGICPRGGVEVARESADVVLADKDLTAIGHAIAAGRHSSGNIATYLRITLSSNLGNVIAMLAAGLLLPFLPMLPVQVLVQNLCFDAAQLAFAHDRPAPAALRRPTVLRPRSFLRFITGYGLLGALADLATFGALALTAGAWDDAAAFHSGWFTENLLAQALVILLLRTGPRPAPGPLRAAAAALAAIGVLLPLTPLGGPLGLTSLPLPYYALLAGILAVYVLVLVGVRTRQAQP
ncbi:magnesium-translocating P-type ATPase [Streptomyces kanamyceticus]|uniref:Magnesium-transporting ATPase, P-type 1 n=1 Tax=Streptomyces kanamyceticus TaxID=1967 RepID=A0A5J6GSM4_STRKN|nr:magnesium-translocating P-type ATPase [Streptomyces kanamyceticus]QEU97211.1 magnesium-translocating P-type ATPase [Streptomyces kanamyceticus]